MTRKRQTDDIIGIDHVEFAHGGRYDVGFWTTGTLYVIKTASEQEIRLNDDDSEDLEATILLWLKKRGYQVDIDV